MTRETKVGLIVAASFLGLLGIVIVSRLRGTGDTAASNAANTATAQGKPTAPEKETGAAPPKEGDAPPAAVGTGSPMPPAAGTPNILPEGTLKVAQALDNTGATPPAVAPPPPLGSENGSTDLTVPALPELPMSALAEGLPKAKPKAEVSALPPSLTPDLTKETSQPSDVDRPKNSEEEFIKNLMKQAELEAKAKIAAPPQTAVTAVEPPPPLGAGASGSAASASQGTLIGTPPAVAKDKEDSTLAPMAVGEAKGPPVASVPSSSISAGQAGLSPTPADKNQDPPTTAPPMTNPPAAPAIKVALNDPLRPNLLNSLAATPAFSRTDPPTVGESGLATSPVIRVPGGPVNPPTPAAVKPEIEDYDAETYKAKLEDVTFADVSKRFFGNEKYGKALLLFNREHPAAGPNLRQEWPRLQPGQEVFIPPLRILEKKYAAAVNEPGPGSSPVPSPVTAAPSPAPITSLPASPGATPAPSAPKNVPAATDPKRYRVRDQGEMVYEIARDKLGDGRRWPEIYRLNPGIRPEYPVPGGTELRLPGDARVQ